MAKTYSVELTDAEVKAMEYVAYSPQDWLDNVFKNRARRAIDEIYDLEVKRMTDDPSIDSIPADKTKVVLDADIKSAKQRNDEILNQKSEE